MLTKYHEDLTLVQALREDQPGAWSRFVDRYSNTVLNLLRPWCESTCRRPREQYQCMLQVVRAGRHDAQRETCDEAVEMYLFSFRALRSRIPKYQGKSSLSTYIGALMRFIHHDYFRNKFHRITLPAAVQKLPQCDQAVYKLMRRGRSEFEMAQELALTAEEVRAGQSRVRDALRRRGEEWEHLDAWLASHQVPLSLIPADAQSEDGTSLDIPVTDRPPEQVELVTRLLDSFARLNPVQQRLLDLRYGRDYSAEQIAELGRRLPALGVSDAKEVYRVMDRALVRWLQLVREGYGEELAGDADIKAVKESLPDLFHLAVFRPQGENEAEETVKEG